jgi:hypothetical protein
MDKGAAGGSSRQELFPLPGDRPMPTTTDQATTAAPALYMALELSAADWLLTFATGPGQARRHAKVRARDRAAVLVEIARQGRAPPLRGHARRLLLRGRPAGWRPRGRARGGYAATEADQDFSGGDLTAAPS